MSHHPEDIYTPYEIGLELFIQQLGQTHASNENVVAYQQRLIKNIAIARQYGDTEARRTERSEIVEQLNRIARATLNITLSELSNLPPPRHELSRWSCTDTENRLRQHVRDSRLRASLTAIRQTVDYVWDDNAPRVVQDGPDFGIEYCKRMVEMVAKILDANEGYLLSTYEMYILLAGIYLHGIGLQCDIIALPEVKKLAEKMGATFPSMSETIPRRPYTLEKERDIYHNYSYLSAAWIDYANRSGETDLGPAAMTVPKDLIDDLMDVCKHHTLLPITTCPITFTFDPDGRKQLIAALIRLAHEFDFVHQNASLKVIQRFASDPSSKIYWWLYHHATISFEDQHTIRLHIPLHPDDEKSYRTIIQTTCINEFEYRNIPSLHILKRNGIPLDIDTTSWCITNEYQEHMPTELFQERAATTKYRETLVQLADEIRLWLCTLDYEVCMVHQIEQNVVDMHAYLNTGTVKQHIFVRCLDRQMSPNDIDLVHASLQHTRAQGWVVSTRRVSDLVRRRVAECFGIEVFSIGEFLHQKLWSPYIRSVMSMVEQNGIVRQYVERTGCVQHSQVLARKMCTRCSNISNYLDAWLHEEKKHWISIVGDSGMGKTWLCRYYAYRQLKRYLKDPLNERLPVLVSLRNLNKGLDLQDIFNEVLSNHFMYPSLASPRKVFDSIERRGKILLILDGFDDIAQQLDDQSLIHIFQQLGQLSHCNTKIILSGEAVMVNWISVALHKNPKGVDLHTSWDIIHLEPFSNEQISHAITNRLGKEKSPHIKDMLLQRPELLELARKPIHLALLVYAMDQSDKRFNTATQLYLFAISKLAFRSDNLSYPLVCAGEWIGFLCELAWKMEKSGKQRIHTQDMDEYTNVLTHRCALIGWNNRTVDDPCPNVPIEDKDNWEHIPYEQPLVSRDAAGYYEFFHKSLVDYLVAFKFAAELGCLLPEYALNAYGEDQQLCLIRCMKPKDVSDLGKTFGHIALGDRKMGLVRTFLVDMLSEQATVCLWNIIAATKEKTPEQVKYLGGNAAMLLHLRGESFTGANLAHTVLTRANLQNICLTGADLSHAILARSNLRYANLAQVNLQHAYLRETILDFCCLEGADLRQANLVNAQLAKTSVACSIDWSSNGRYMASGGSDGIIRIWSAHSFDEIHRLSLGREIWQIAFSPSGRYIAAQCEDGHMLLWHVDDWQYITMTGLENKETTALLWSTDDHHLLFAECDGTINQIDVTLMHVSSISKVTEQTITCMTLSPNGSELAVGCGDGSVLILDSYHCTNKQQLLQPNGGPVRAICYSPDGSLLLVAFHHDHIVRWTTIGYVCQDDRALFTPEQESHPAPASISLAFSPNGHHVVIARDEPGLSEVWETSQWKRVASFVSALSSVCYSPDGRYLATGSTGAILIWAADSQEPSFVQPLHVLDFTMHCNGMQISGARGLEQATTWQKAGTPCNGSLLDYLLACGAVGQPCTSSFANCPSNTPSTP